MSISGGERSTSVTASAPELSAAEPVSRVAAATTTARGRETRSA